MLWGLLLFLCAGGQLTRHHLPGKLLNDTPPPFFFFFSSANPTSGPFGYITCCCVVCIHKLCMHVLGHLSMWGALWALNLSGGDIMCSLHFERQFERFGLSQAISHYSWWFMLDLGMNYRNACVFDHRQNQRDKKEKEKHVRANSFRRVSCTLFNQLTDRWFSSLLDSAGPLTRSAPVNHRTLPFPQYTCPPLFSPSPSPHPHPPFLSKQTNSSSLIHI